MKEETPEQSTFRVNKYVAGLFSVLASASIIGTVTMILKLSTTQTVNERMEVARQKELTEIKELLGEINDKIYEIQTKDLQELRGRIIKIESTIK